MIRETDYLDALPDQAVVYDHDNQVWQKLLGRYLLEQYSTRYEWFRPGDEQEWESARLLDDGR